MLLAVDIGNTDIVWGIHDGEQWIEHWRVPGQLHTRAAAELDEALERHALSFAEIDQVVVSSVVPGLTPNLLSMITQKLGIKPLLLGGGVYKSIGLQIDNPEEIGTDLVANAVAAYQRFEGNCVVVDFGTALTFTSISAEAKIQGVAIAPGLKTAMLALFQNAAQLPEVPLELPDSAIGKNTAHAIQAGILIGYVGLVEKLLNQIKMEMGTSCKVIATGGLVDILHPLHVQFDAIEPMLTLEGLRLIAATQYSGK